MDDEEDKPCPLCGSDILYGERHPACLTQLQVVQGLCTDLGFKDDLLLLKDWDGKIKTVK